MRYTLARLIMLQGVMVGFAAHAESTTGSIAPLPFVATESEQQKNIVPPDAKPGEAAIMTTRDQPAETLPWQKAEPSPAAPPAATYQRKIPFGRGEAESSGPAVPSGPRATAAVPVVGVDAVEASEPAPPTPTDPAADPVQENPEEATELTSPIFEAEVPDNSPRKLSLRVLNKVTAQSQLLTMKPGEVVKFGQLEIRGIACQISSPESQTDYAGLLDISELSPVPGQAKKTLFHGWMYASSPSITALEHPVYDVTMVECTLTKPETKADAKAEDKPAKKPQKKGKN